MHVQDRGHSWYSDRRVDCVCWLGFEPRSKIFYLHWINGISQLKAKDFGVEVQLRLKYPLDILSLAKAVLLALESKISYRQPFGAHGFHHLFGLIRRDDLV